MLSVVVPPDFIPEETSSDVMIREGGQVNWHLINPLIILFIVSQEIRCTYV